MRRGSAAGRGGATLPRSRGRAGPGVSPEPLVPTPQPPRSSPVTAWRGVSQGGCPAGPPGQPLSFGHPRAIPVPLVDPRSPGVDPGARAAALPSSLLRCPPPGARPGRRGPRTPFWAAPGPAPASRAGPCPGPARGTRLKFAGSSPPNRAVGRARAADGAGRAPPAEKPNKHFLTRCGQREKPVGSSPWDRRSDPQGQSSCQACLFPLQVGATFKSKAVRYRHTLK